MSIELPWIVSGQWSLSATTRVPQDYQGCHFHAWRDNNANGGQEMKLGVFDPRIVQPEPTALHTFNVSILFFIYFIVMV